MIERDTPTQRMYAQQNANFDVTALVDTSGNVQERYIYDPFGSVTIPASNWTTRGSSNYGWVYLHQGGRFDFATGLFAFRKRDYSPALGRWIELDPVGFKAGDLDLYRYLGDSPIGHRDPLGTLSGTFLDSRAAIGTIKKVTTPPTRPTIPACHHLSIKLLLLSGAGIKVRNQPQPMCGRYVVKTPVSRLAKKFDLIEPPTLFPRFNAAPTQEVPVVRLKPETNQRELAMLKWGLIPTWAREAAIGNRMINARADTLTQKPAFQSAFRERRCLMHRAFTSARPPSPPSPLPPKRVERGEEAGSTPTRDWGRRRR